MTCSRRYFSASACGSSRVLMIGRDRVVALETPSQMCSARWLRQNAAAFGRLQHLARAADQLAGDQERQQDVGDPGELPGPHDEVVLVAAVGVSGRVGVVLEQVDVAADALVGQPLLGVDEQVLEDPLTRAVVGDQLDEVVALGGGVLGVAAHVQVQPRAVAQEYVRAAAPRHHAAEQIPRNLVRAQPAMAVERAGDTEFGFDAHDPSLHTVEPTGCCAVAVGKRCAKRLRVAADCPVERRNRLAADRASISHARTHGPGHRGAEQAHRPRHAGRRRTDGRARYPEWTAGPARLSPPWTGPGKPPLTCADWARRSRPGWSRPAARSMSW